MEVWHSAKKILKKKIEALCRVPHVLALGKESFKKNLKKSLPSAGRVDTRQSDRQRNRRRDGRFSLPSVSGALGKAFAECPIKYTRQRVLCRSIFCRVCFAECHTRQRLCRVQYSLCRVPQALGKEPESSSAWLHTKGIYFLRYVQEGNKVAVLDTNIHGQPIFIF